MDLNNLDLSQVPPEVLKRAQEEAASGKLDGMSMPEKIKTILGDDCTVKRVDKDRRVVGESRPEDLGLEIQNNQRMGTMVGREQSQDGDHGKARTIRGWERV